jgi:hypothetical protein
VCVIFAFFEIFGEKGKINKLHYDRHKQ